MAIIPVQNVHITQSHYLQRHMPAVVPMRTKHPIHFIHAQADVILREQAGVRVEPYRGRQLLQNVHRVMWCILLAPPPTTPAEAPSEMPGHAEQPAKSPIHFNPPSSQP